MRRHADRCTSRRLIYRIEFFAYPRLVHSRMSIVWVWFCHIQFFHNDSLSSLSHNVDLHSPHISTVSSTLTFLTVSTHPFSTVRRAKFLPYSASIRFSRPIIRSFGINTHSPTYFQECCPSFALQRLNTKGRSDDRCPDGDGVRCTYEVTKSELNHVVIDE